MLKRIAPLLILALVLGFSAAQSTIRIGLSLGPANLNPPESTGLADATVIRHIFEGLVGFDPDGSLVPELAESWTVNPTATEYVFKLREGVVFHDGTAFNADTASRFYEWALDPDSAGLRARAQLAGVTSIEATGEYELTFTLAAPNGAFLYNLALSESRIASPVAIETYGEDAFRQPVGTGPFQFVSWESGVNVTLEAFPDYWGEPARTDRLVFLEVPNASTRMAMLQSGEVDFIENVAPQLVGQIEASADLDLISVVGTSARILQLNTSKAPFDDVRVRRALNYAVDKDQVVRIALQGLGTPLTGPLPEPVFGHVPQEPYTYDPERARELLAEAGYEDGFDMTVLTFIGDEYSLVGQMLQQYFADVGVNMTLDPKERGALVDQLFQPQESNPTEAGLVGMTVATGDADSGLRMFFSRDSWPPSANNWSFYFSERLEELLQAGIATADPDERLAVYAEAGEVIWNDAPWVFLYSATSLAASRSNVSDVYFMPVRTVDARWAYKD